MARYQRGVECEVGVSLHQFSAVPGGGRAARNLFVTIDVAAIGLFGNDTSHPPDTLLAIEFAVG